MKPIIVFAITIPIVAAVVVAFSVFLVPPMGQQNFEEDTHENQHEDAAWQSLQKMQGESVVSAKCSGTQRCILGVVTDIIDGDTIRVGGESVRFALSSAPELDETRGTEAREFIGAICPPGSDVTVDQDDLQPVDRYGRVLGVIYCNDVNLNERLLESGWGYLSSQFCSTSEFENASWAQKYGC